MAGGVGGGEPSRERVRKRGEDGFSDLYGCGACGGPRVGPSWARPAGARACSSGLDHCERALTRPREVGLEEVSNASDFHEQCELKISDLIYVRRGPAMTIGHQRCKKKRKAD